MPDDQYRLAARSVRFDTTVGADVLGLLATSPNTKVAIRGPTRIANARPDTANRRCIGLRLDCRPTFGSW